MKNILTVFLAIGICFAFSSTDNESFISVFDTPQIIELDATLNMADCNNKAFLPIDLPKGAKGLIYTINVVSKADTREAKNQLINHIKKHSQTHQPSEMVALIKQNKSNKSFNFYILPGKENKDGFYNCGHYKYLEKHIDTKSRAAFIDGLPKEEIIFGIEKSQDLQNLKLSIEVVAIM